MGVDIRERIRFCGRSGWLIFEIAIDISKLRLIFFEHFAQGGACNLLKCAFLRTSRADVLVDDLAAIAKRIRQIHIRLSR